MVANRSEWTPTRLRSLLSQDATYGIVTAGTFVRSGVPMVRGGDIKAGRIGRDMPHVSPKKSDEFRRTIVKRGDVLIALVGYPGEAAVVPPDLEGANISRAVGLLRPTDELLPEFLTCYLNSSVGRAEFLKPSAGSAQIVVNLRDLNNLYVPLPSTIAEQEDVARKLLDADAQIEGIQAIITKKKAIRQGFAQELLTGKRRLPGFTQAWNPHILSDAYEFKNGLNKEKRFFGIGTPIINYMDVFSSPYIRPDGIAGRVTVSAVERSNYSARKDDVFFTRTSETVDEIGMASVLTDELANAVFSGFVLRARPKQNLLKPAFAGHVLRSEYVRRQIMATASYTTRALTNGRLLSAIKLDVPPPDEQVAIACVLSDLDREIEALSLRLGKARKIKQGMGRELLASRVAFA